MSGTVTIYSTSWCGYCRRLKGQMEREGIAYTEINIEQDPESAKFVEQVNNGNQLVPTVLFPDGSALANPSLAQLKQKIDDPRATRGKKARAGRDGRSAGGQAGQGASGLPYQSSISRPAMEMPYGGSISPDS